jgi:hypothetical protein
VATPIPIDLAVQLQAKRLRLGANMAGVSTLKEFCVVGDQELETNSVVTLFDATTGRGLAATNIGEHGGDCLYFFTFDDVPSSLAVYSIRVSGWEKDEWLFTNQEMNDTAWFASVEWPATD